jgi:hypothetical protein
MRGWIDLHYPCEGHIKLQIRGSLAEDCLNPLVIQTLLPMIIKETGIDPATTYSAIFFKSSKEMHITQAVDENGMTDRIQTTRKYHLPRGEEDRGSQ